MITRRVGFTALHLTTSLVLGLVEGAFLPLLVMEFPWWHGPGRRLGRTAAVAA